MPRGIPNSQFSILNFELPLTHPENGEGGSELRTKN